MSDEIRIGSRAVGPAHPPYVIAEMSGNHNGSLDRALAIVDACAKAGADAVKLQTYTPDTMTLDSREPAFVVRDPGGPWDGRSLHELYREAQTPWEWHAPIFKRCRELGLAAFSSPFDRTAVDFLAKLDVPAYKIASFENIDLPLIRAAACTGKPVIISTGMATAEEIAEAVDAARGAGARGVILLKCTSAYPASPENSNLATIPDLIARFGALAGISDHTLGIGAAVAAVTLGAVVIEKHVTLSRAEGGVDSGFSLEPHELKALVEESRRAWQSVGRIAYGPGPKEIESIRFRRSLWVVRDLAAGELLSSDSVRVLRPAGGLPPKHFDEVLGKRVKSAVKRGTALTAELLAEPL
jgi:N-acetylneuraminate synthase